MKSQELTLLILTIRNFGSECIVDTTRDIETVTSRFRDQGFSFISITLPSFEADFLESLADGEVSPDHFAGFRRSGGLPAFLQGFLELIFDRTTGVLLDEPSIPAIQAIRQICLMFGKVKLECTPKRNQRAVEAYIECERELAGLEDRISPSDRQRFSELGSMLFSHVFMKLNEDTRDFGLRPKHGPGTTADRLIANGKYALPRWTERLESVFPYWKYGTSRDYCTDKYDTVQFYEPGQEPPVEVILVPKTLKTPRVIAREPTHMQYVQQAYLERFTDYVRRDPFLKHFIDTELQSPNQELARKGSIDGTLATLDLSEASDRVSNFLVKDLTEHFPHLHDGIQACRSQEASVPVLDRDGNVVAREKIALHKFASMGSALCFPMEMAVFITVIFMGIERAENIRFRSLSQLAEYIGSVRVYGDDIVVPLHTTSSVIDHLSLFGFKVNRRKSFWTGKFRESCGSDWYDGHDVTVARVRQPFPVDRRGVDQLVSAVSLRNQLYERGCWQVVRWLDDEISSLIPFPAVADTASVLGKISFLGYSEERMCPRLQRPMVKGVTVQQTPRRSIADGDAALMKFFLKRGDEPIFQKDHLQYAGRPVASKIRHGWAYSY